MDKTIEYVLEVAQCGSIAKAARNLFITPSALSKFIIQREEELGVRLFVRELRCRDRVELYSYGAAERCAALYAISDPKTVLINEVQTFGRIAREAIHQPKS